VQFLNAIVGWSIDLLLFPFRQLPPIIGLAVVSLASAVAMLVIFRKTSDQRRLAAEKRQLQAAIYEIRLFNDDMRAVLRAQGEVLRRNVTYLRLSLVPMLWIIVPLALVIAQLQFHYGYSGLRSGQSVLVKAQLRQGNTARSNDSFLVRNPPSAAEWGRGTVLEAGDHVEVLTAAVWIPSTNEVIWRIVPNAAGEYELRIRVGDESFTKTVRVSNGVARTSPVRLERGFLNQLLYPAEAPLPGGGPLTAVTVAYPERRIRVFDWEIHWMIVYVLLSMMFAFILRKPLNVTL
jgi:uncharacterized membrane protein (DUF106 family)